MSNWLNRENRVPHYQRLFQKHDGVRLWWKTPRSGLMLYPYFALFYTTGAVLMYASVRKVLGYNSFFGEK